MRAMRSLSVVALAAAVLCSGQAQAATPNALPPVAQLNVHQYMGTWYEMASIPQRFQNQCARNTTATYSLLSPTTVSVTNRCLTAAGAESSFQGKAVVTDTVTNAQLRVEFFKEPNPADTPNYVVTYLDETYTLAVVGNPDRSSGWILSKTPFLTECQWNTAKNIVAERGFRFADFVITPHVHS